MIKIKYIAILLILTNFNKICTYNEDALNLLKKTKTLKECFKDLVPDIVPYTPENYSLVAVIDAMHYKDTNSRVETSKYMHDMGPRDGEKARMWAYHWFAELYHDYQAKMHIYVDGHRNQWLGEMVINMGSKKRGTNTLGEAIVTDVFIYKAYPIYCEIFGNDTISYDVFLTAKQTQLIDRKQKAEIIELTRDRSHFNLTKFLQKVPMKLTHGTTVQNVCNDSVKKNFLRILLIAVIIMAAFGVLMLGSSIIPLWKARHN